VFDDLYSKSTTGCSVLPIVRSKILKLFEGTKLYFGEHGVPYDDDGNVHIPAYKQTPAYRQLEQQYKEARAILQRCGVVGFVVYDYEDGGQRQVPRDWAKWDAIWARVGIQTTKYPHYPQATAKMDRLITYLETEPHPPRPHPVYKGRMIERRRPTVTPAEEETCRDLIKLKQIVKNFEEAIAILDEEENGEYRRQMMAEWNRIDAENKARREAEKSTIKNKKPRK
jgi:hypothetical protein